jgi:hypothetical protein
MRRDGPWVARPRAASPDGLVWMPEDFYREEDAKDRMCALKAAVKVLPSVDDPRDVLMFAQHFYTWLRAAS